MAPDPRPATAFGADDIVELDLATGEKLPVLGSLLEGCTGPSLDLGAGLGYYTRRLLEPRTPPAIATDIALSSLLASRGRLRGCLADAVSLPFAAGTFATVLLADVLEHCPDDRAVLGEIARVTAPGGRLVITVPSLAWGFPDFLDLLGIASVHDQEGPERHFTEGYHPEALEERLGAAGFDVIESRQIMRLGSKLILDAVALAHLVVERGLKKRRSWTWGDLVDSPPPGLGLYRRIFPLVRGVHRLAARLPPRKGFELALAARRRGGASDSLPAPAGASGPGTGTR